MEDEQIFGIIDWIVLWEEELVNLIDREMEAIIEALTILKGKFQCQDAFEFNHWRLEVTMPWQILIFFP